MDVAGILKVKGSHVFTVEPDTRIAEAVQELCDQGVGALVVTVDGRALQGILSERDVVRGLAEHGAAFLDMTVADCMANPVVTCAPGDSDREVMALMTARRFRHLPVVEGGAMIGIVSIGDVVKSRIDAIAAEAEALREYIVRG